MTLELVMIELIRLDQLVHQLYNYNVLKFQANLSLNVLINMVLITKKVYSFTNH